MVATWFYGNCSITFDGNGRVEGWSDGAGILKLK